MMDVLERMECRRQVELVAGDICETVPAYCEAHPEMRFSIINLDTDIYEPACVILEYLYPRLQSGGILILDDYGKFPGETKAVDDYFEGRSIAIKQFPFAMAPCYLVKP
jgi:predicted O-methyltransferase YrrM